MSIILISWIEMFDPFSIENDMVKKYIQFKKKKMNFKRVFERYRTYSKNRGQGGRKKLGL